MASRLEQKLLEARAKIKDLTIHAIESRKDSEGRERAAIQVRFGKNNKQKTKHKQLLAFSFWLLASGFWLLLLTWISTLDLELVQTLWYFHLTILALTVWVCCKQENEKLRETNAKVVQQLKFERELRKSDDAHHVRYCPGTLLDINLLVCVDGSFCCFTLVSNMTGKHPD